MSMFISLKYGEFKNSPSVMPKLCATKKTVDNLTSFVLPFSIVWIVVLSKQVSFINLYCVLFFQITNLLFFLPPLLLNSYTTPNLIASTNQIVDGNTEIFSNFDK